MAGNRYQLRITAEIFKLGPHGEFLSPDRFSMNRDVTLDLGSFGELVDVLALVHQLGHQVDRRQAATRQVLDQIRAESGADPCNCLGDGWHVHISSERASELAARHGVPIGGPDDPEPDDNQTWAAGHQIPTTGPVVDGPGPTAGARAPIAQAASVSEFEAELAAAEAWARAQRSSRVPDVPPEHQPIG